MLHDLGLVRTQYPLLIDVENEKEKVK